MLSYLHIKTYVVAVVFLIASLNAHAAEITGHVISVADGDTITISDSRSQHLRIRLAGIDAPERGQPFGKKSADNLSRLVRRQEVLIRWDKKDRYGRLIGVVIHRGQDINLEQVRAGYAWWFREFADEQSPRDRISYARAERYAMENSIGLWSDQQPVPPWVWRRNLRK